MKNINDNKHHAHFVYLIGEKLEENTELIRNLLSNDKDIVFSVFYVPNGVTFRHIFAAATMFNETFLVHNADIEVGRLDSGSTSESESDTSIEEA